MGIHYSKHFSTKTTPQTQPIPGANQTKNDAGGYSFTVGSRSLFHRFLILGSDTNYYKSATDLTVENAKNVIEVIKTDGRAAVHEIVQVSISGRAPKNEPAIFALALAATFGDAETKFAAYAAITQVCRTGTHLFTFVQNIQDLRGWSRGLRTGVANFYTEKSDDKLAYQLIKYRQRNGWTHKDVIRLCHPKKDSKLIEYAVKQEMIGETPHPQIMAFEMLKQLGTRDVKQSAHIISDYKLPWEAVPTELLKEKAIWEVLLPNMGLTAVVRNLGKLTNIGLIQSNLDDATKLVRGMFNQENVARSKIHPLQLLIAQKTYAQGHGEKGKLSWSPVQAIVDALDGGFYSAFGNVEATGKNTLLAVDCSGSMTYTGCAGSSLTPREGAVAMALVTANVEPNHEIIAFDSDLYKVKLSPKMRLSDAMAAIPQTGKGTDCSLPMQYADTMKLNIDAFVSYTDSQSWSGTQHPVQALNKYRKKFNPNARAVNVAMVANSYTTTEPGDSNSLNLTGFDAATPQLISAFLGLE